MVVCIYYDFIKIQKVGIALELGNKKIIHLSKIM